MSTKTLLDHQRDILAAAATGDPSAFEDAQARAFGEMTGRAWVRYRDGKLVLGGAGGNRPLTLRERVAWRIARRVPSAVRAA